jgi:flavin-dependent dehydrogenase
MDAHSPVEVVDAAIIGGGPAGSAAGRLLASWGHRVIVVHRAGSARRSLCESLPPSIRRLFSALGVLQRLDGAGYYRATGNTVWWAEAPRRVERFRAEHDSLGYQVRRDEFDQQLRTLAIEAGARVLTGVARIQETSAGGQVIALNGTGSRVLVQAHFVLDCSGRTGTCARRGLRRPEIAFQTLAIGAMWENDRGWPDLLEDPTHTVVETYPDGWAWSVPLAPNRRYVAVMIDPRYSLGAASGNLTSVYYRELAKARAVAAISRQAMLTAPPTAHDASPYTAARFADDNVLLVGDAGSFIDPLSSYGVKKALASAWRAAVVVNTCLTRSTARGFAFDYFSRRECEVYEAFCRQSAQFFSEARSAYDRPFWADRAAGLSFWSKATPHEAIDLRNDPDVHDALARLKTSPTVALRRHPGVRVERRPEIVGREVALQEVLVSDALPSGARFVSGVDLPALVSMVEAHAEVPALFDAYNRCHAPANLPDFLGALSVLLAKGILTNDL